MQTLRRVLRWLSFGWNRKARDRELEAELQFHLEEEAAEREQDGLSPEAARRAARLDLGEPHRRERGDSRDLGFGRPSRAGSRTCATECARSRKIRLSR